MTRTKKFTKQPSEFIDTLPVNVIPIRNYDAWGRIFDFNRYWWDPVNHRIIMKPKRMKKYKIVKPMTDKYHDCSFVYFMDVNDDKIWVNYEKLIGQLSK